MDVKCSVYKIVETGLVSNPGEGTLSKSNIHFFKGRPILLARSQHQIFKRRGQMDQVGGVQPWMSETSYLD